CQHGYGTPWTF
nr:immunoglobulin light chain junction region [Macaca mulatta]